MGFFFIFSRQTDIDFFLEIDIKQPLKCLPSTRPLKPEVRLVFKIVAHKTSSSMGRTENSLGVVIDRRQTVMIRAY